MAKMKVADGLEVTLFAAEPDLFNPTTIDVDAQGRVWVCEARNYRLFKQPITDKAGDRIRVLEDTDGDGRCDKATTFYQDPSLQAPMGIAVLGDRVYICQSPDLFYLEDTDKDGVADKRTVVLTGFAGIDGDHAIHGVTFGPDGYLYFSNGDQGLDVTDQSGNRVHVGKNAPHMAASVLRCDLDGNRLELIAEGMRNPYEPAVDPWGNVFISDNDDDGNEQCRVNFVMDGANYGYWPRRKGDRKLDEVHWNTDRPGVMPTMVKTGFGSPTGLMFYQGNLLQKHQNTLIHADAGPRVIRSYRPRFNGAGFSAKIDILLSNEADTWFRPSDVCSAPDGAIFISDWYDPGVGGHRMGDTARGRIYRLAPKGVKHTVPPFDLSREEGIAHALNSPNQARRYQAHVELSKPQFSVDTTLLRGFAASQSADYQARATWLLAQNETLANKFVLGAFANKSTLLRVQAVRIAARLGFDDVLLAAASDVDPQVRRQVALSLASRSAEPSVAKILMHVATQYDGIDRVYRESIGIAFRGKESWAFNEVIARLGDTWDARLAGLVIQLHPPDALPLVQSALGNKKLGKDLHTLAIDALDAIGTKESGRELVAVLGSDASPDVKNHALHHLARDGGDAWRGVTEGDAMLAYLNSALANPELRGAALAFVRDTQLVPMLGHVAALAASPDTSPDVRVQALGTVQAVAARARRNESAEYLKPMASLLESDDADTRSAAVKAIGAFKGDDATDVLTNVLADANGNSDVRREAMHALSNSRAGANVLVALAEKQGIPQDLLLDATELLNSHSSEQIRLIAQKVLPRAATREGTALPPLAELLAMSGDPARGKETFFSPDRAQCYRCHVINGEGKAVGPDLSKIGQKASKENLFDSILNPSAAIAPEYKVWIVTSFEEGALSGFIKSDTPEAVELMDSAGNTIRLDPKDITERSESSASLMPNGLTAALTAQELADVVAYLLTLK
ncbi:MAG: HEAT repeat domain-containing protein [Candidatus Hydrogenedentes bacterium]|nr:HEAT repeat domain-containing protein [Candidatus Hydrogenedentota bacterium]